MTTRTPRQLNAEMRMILATAEAAGRDRLTAEEEKRYDALDREYTRLDSRFLGAVSNEDRSEADRIFTRYLRTGEIRASAGLTTSPNQGGTSSEDAGYMVPQGFWQNLQVALKQYGGVERDFKLVETETGNPMPWPTVDPTAVTGNVLSQDLTTEAEISPYVFGQGLLSAWTLTNGGPILAARQLIEDAAFDVDAFVADRIGEAIGRKLAALAMNGSGSSQPLGLITALAAYRGGTVVVPGTTSGGVLALGTATTLATFGPGGTASVTELAGNVLAPQTLLSMISAVDPAYRNDADGNPTAAFYVNDLQLAGMRKVTNSFGEPILQQPSSGGAPELWGYPVKVDVNIPNLTASTVGGPIFGNLGVAMVHRRVHQGASVIRMGERYANQLAIGYYGYLRVDYRSNDLRAAVTVKPAGT
jgi:HK97 family phage major capsid protein